LANMWSKRPRIPKVVSDVASDGPRSFPYTVEVKDKTVFFAAWKNGEADNFFGSVVSPNGAELTMPVHHLIDAPKAFGNSTSGRYTRRTQGLG